MRIFPRIKPGVGIFRLADSSTWLRIINVLSDIEGDGGIYIEKPVDSEGRGWRVTVPAREGESTRAEMPRMPFTGYYNGATPRIAFGFAYMNGERVTADYTANEHMQDLHEDRTAYVVLYKDTRDQGPPKIRYGIYDFDGDPLVGQHKLASIPLAFFSGGKVTQYHEGEIYFWDFAPDDISLEEVGGKYQIMTADAHDTTPLDIDSHDIMLRGFKPPAVKRTPDFGYTSLSRFFDTVESSVYDIIYGGATSGDDKWLEFFKRVARAIMWDHHDKDPPNILNHPACTLWDPTCTVPKDTACVATKNGHDFASSWVPLSAALGDLGAPNKAAMNGLLARVEELGAPAAALAGDMAAASLRLAESSNALDQAEPLIADARAAKVRADKRVSEATAARDTVRPRLDSVLARIESVNARIKALGG